MTLPPGPRMPLALQSARMFRDPLGFLSAGRARFGDVFTIRMFVSGSVVVVADPGLLRGIFGGDPDLYRGGEGQQMIELMVGPGSIFLADGEAHSRMRRVLLPPFHRTAVSRYGENIEEIARSQMATWELGRRIPIHEGMREIAMQVICQIIFGLQGADEIAELRRGLLLMREPTQSLIMLPWLRRDLGRWSPWTRFRRRRESVDEMIYKVISRRREQPSLEGEVDMVSLLIQATDEDGQPLSDQDIRDQLMSMVIAGFETTATALAWTMDLLSHHPDALDRLRASLGDGDESYLTAVIHEALRLYPPIFHVARRLARSTEIAGYEIPGGVNIMLAILLLHRHEEVYQDPAAFRPERFVEQRPSRGTWVPFGDGHRLCLGQHFAELEMHVVMKELLRRFDVAPGRRDRDRGALFHVTLVPARGGQVVLRSRQPTATGS